MDKNERTPFDWLEKHEDKTLTFVAIMFLLGFIMLVTMVATKPDRAPALAADVTHQELNR